jgi:hypothetical protein
MPRSTATVEILTDHAHHATGDCLLDLPGAPRTVGGERHPRASLPGEVAGGRGGGPVERAGVEFLALAEAHEEKLRHVEARGPEQRNAFVPPPRDLPGRHEPCHKAAGGPVDVGARARPGPAFGQK